MLTSILRFEWRYHTRQVSFAAAALLFLVFGMALGGVLRFGADNVAVNSPWLVMEASGLLSLMAIIAAAVFASGAVLRDDEYRMAEIVHSTPLGRFRYLAGRFGGAFLATVTAVAFSPLGMALGALSPWADPERVAPMDVRPYLAAFGVISAPNVFFITALLFAVAVLTRNAVATYATSVVLYILYFASAALTNSPLMAGSRPGGGTSESAALLDPLGLTSFFALTRHWTAAEKNLRFVPLEGTLLLNRLIWVAAAFAVLALIYRRFDFRVRRTRRVARVVQASALLPVHEPETEGRPEVSTPPTTPSAFSAWLSCTRMELRTLFTRSSLLLLLAWIALAISEIYGDVLAGEYLSTSYPVTSLVIRALAVPADLIGMILIVYYSAEIFWREQRFRFAPIADSAPVASGAVVVAKWTALAVMIGALLAGGAAAGVLVQLSRGWLQIEPLLYLSFFYFTGMPLLLYAAAALLIHALSPGRYAGMLLFLLFAIVTQRAGLLGVEHDLLQFANPPAVRYTAFNGYGSDAGAFHWFTLYWTMLALLFVACAAMMWRRIGAGLAERFRRLRPTRVTVALLVAFVVTGSWIFYNTNVAQAYVPSNELFDWKADYEKQYKQFEKLPRPSIAAVEATVDLFPEAQAYRVAGRYELVNDQPEAIETLFVVMRREAQAGVLTLSAARKVSHDERFGMTRFAFDPPLAPGARAELRFELSFDAKGFGNGQQDDAVVANGSYLMSFRAFPTLGYRRSYELNRVRERRKRGLAGSGAVPLEGDGSHGAAEASEEEWIDLALTVTTSRDQIAVAPGKLEASGERDGRRWFRYRTESPVLNRFAITSARYSVARRQHGDVAVELYHHPAHGTNVPHMLDVAAASLDVLEPRFGKYPHRELRVAEIPSYWPMAGFALPGVVYVREDRSFLTDQRDPDRPDLVGRRLAHEIAHQWFGHRLYSGNVEGASLLIESLTKYAELLVIERLHGREKVKQLLEIELDRYLGGRSDESVAEVPLMRVDDQPYLFYSKGAIVFFALRDLLGEEAVNGAIRAVMNDPQPTSARLVAHLRAAAGDRAALVDQWMTEIVLYDFRVERAEARRRADGRYDVTVRVDARKLASDGQGNEHARPLDETIEIAVDANTARHRIRSGANDIHIIVGEKPSEVTIDPWITRVDRNPQDNSRRF